MKDVADMTDAEVLAASGHGLFGPGIVGQEVFDRAQGILKATAGGVLGPAIADHDFATKANAQRAATEQEPDDVKEDAAEDAGDPWASVTLSGAKVLAQHNGVSYKPRPKRADLIKLLQKAGVEPPAPLAEDEP